MYEIIREPHGLASMLCRHSPRFPSTWAAEHSGVLGEYWGTGTACTKDEAEKTIRRSPYKPGGGKHFYHVLNPIRAGIIADPADYGFFSWGEWNKDGWHPFLNGVSCVVFSLIRRKLWDRERWSNATPR